MKILYNKNNADHVHANGDGPLPSGLFGPGMANLRRASGGRTIISRSKRESNPVTSRTMSVREIFRDPRANSKEKEGLFWI